MPTFKLNGNLVHFAAFKNHIGFFPAPSGIDAFEKELKPYRTGKGTLQFPLDKPLPLDLIIKVAEFRVRENLSKELKEKNMCRNIKTLFNFDPPATDEEIHDASLQFVRKLSGFNRPSEVNLDAYNSAVAEVSKISKKLLDSLKTNANPHNREEEARLAHERAVKRFGGN